jgi:endoglucanase
MNFNFIHKIFDKLSKSNLPVYIFSFVLTFSVYPQNIYVNKTGYLTGSVKHVYFSNSSDSFYVFNKTNNSLAFKNSLVLIKENDPSTGMILYRGDFSSLQLPGDYYITNKSNLRSSDFKLSQSVFNDVFKKSLKAFYFQRCGTALFSSNAGLYQHSVCHRFDGFFHFSSDTSGFKLATGGWHDAGDFGKYVVNAGITVGTLLLAYQLFPDFFKSDDLNIPESGNNIPDILDEVKYELEWLLKMQSRSGGVYTKLTRENFAGFIMPQNDGVTRYIYEISSTATGNFAAVMAMAFRAFKNFDSSFADNCLFASRKAWNFLSTNNSIVPSGGFKNPLGTNTGEYGDNNDTDERLWASSELFRSTGELEFQNYFLANYSKAGLFSSAMNWQNVNSMSQLSYLLNDSPQVNAIVKTDLQNALLNLCNSLVNVINQNGFNVAISPGNYNWGSNSEVLNRALLLIIANYLSSNKDYYDAALSQLNYILGINVLNISFVTGVGDKYPMHPHHRPSSADGISEPIPGMLVGGPNQYLSDGILTSRFNSSTPPALCYIDDEGSYASNEIAINWNAPLVFVAGFFNGQGTPVSVGKNEISIPINFRLKQNYPNPFNPETTIEYSIPFKKNEQNNSIVEYSKSIQNVSLKVYDVLGIEITTLVSGAVTPGNYSVKFNTDSLPSGVYFYRLSAGNYSDTKKMLLLR